MKSIAMYLPQFHRTPENDLWWGEGFTEWTALKKAKSLYEGHEQPKLPYNENYYDLSDINVMKWQAELMAKYDVDGLCFYHYWFENGKKILEFPAENLIKHKEINMPFCFCWANESWIRSWSNIDNAQVWMQEDNIDKNGPEILLNQKYGEEKDWQKHFDYLLDFFKDERYIKIENKPVFLIYKSALISCLSDMLDLWRKKAVENGFNGLYIIGMNANQECEKYIDAKLYHEPQNTLINLGLGKYSCSNDKNISAFVEYNDIWDNLLLEKKANIKTFFGGFVGYDDTPRRGNAGTVIWNQSSEKFREYLTELYAKNAALKNEFVFINAWNEWGEGMYLEPDNKNKYEYLEAFLYAKENYKNRICKYQKSFLLSLNSVDGLVLRNQRLDSYWRILHKMLNLKENHQNLGEYLLKMGYRNIAVYGLGILGKHLLNELKESSVNICYGIDRDAKNIHIDINMYNPNEELPYVDCVIVTTVNIYSEIEKVISEKNICKNIISLERILEQC